MTDIKVFSSGAVVVHKIDDVYQYLLLRAYNHWDFPKGVVEQGESPLEGALREIQEETCLTDIDFRWGYDYIETGPYGARRKIARYYLGHTNQEDIILAVNPALGKAEHDEYRWVDYEKALQLVSARVKGVVEWANKLIHTSP